jgi:hypothetical protein
MDLDLLNNLVNISYAFIFSGILVVFLTVGSHNESALIGTITGYSASIAGTLLLGGLTYYMISSNKIWPGWQRMFYSLSPFVLLLIILGLSLAYVSIYFDKISNNKVTNYYSSFSYMSLIFVCFQLYFFVSAINQREFRERASLSPKSVSILNLFGVINMIILITLGITLKYYSTDC